MAKINSGKDFFDDAAPIGAIPRGEYPAQIIEVKDIRDMDKAGDEYHSWTLVARITEGMYEGRVVNARATLSHDNPERHRMVARGKSVLMSAVVACGIDPAKFADSGDSDDLIGIDLVAVVRPQKEKVAGTGDEEKWVDSTEFSEATAFKPHALRAARAVRAKSEPVFRAPTTETDGADGDDPNDDIPF